MGGWFPDSQFTAVVDTAGSNEFFYNLTTPFGYDGSGEKPVVGKAYFNGGTGFGRMMIRLYRGTSFKGGVSQFAKLRAQIIRLRCTGKFSLIRKRKGYTVIILIRSSQGKAESRICQKQGDGIFRSEDLRESSFSNS